MIYKEGMKWQSKLLRPGKEKPAEIVVIINAHHVTAPEGKRMLAEAQSLHKND